jgi:Fe-S-cluster containining protein
MEKTDETTAASPKLSEQYKEFDVAIESIFKQARAEGSTIPCKKGCHACCYEAVLMTHFEAEPFVDALRALPKDVRRGIKLRLLDWFRRMKKAGVKFGGEPNRSEYYKAHLACPALDPETKACLIYDARPIACRAHHIVNASPDVCSNIVENPRVPSIMLNEQVNIPFLTWIMGQHDTPTGKLMMAMGMMPLFLWAVWPLVEDRSLSVDDWIDRANRQGVKLQPPAI